ncbi:MAG: hypothetical protein QOI20_632 [Acidimicrobiaceae bacterium]|nr:hypothetical protein [Acidimicrobiaceae bacterium]
MISSDLRAIGGALASFWAGGAGPTRSQTLSALSIAGCDFDDAGNKQDLVRDSVLHADNATGRGAIEELVALLREAGYFDSGSADANVKRLKRAFEAGGYQFSEDGYIKWGPQPSEQSGASVQVGGRPMTRPSVGPESGSEVALTPTVRHEVTEPSVPLLISCLRRLGSGALRPIIRRRRADRPAITVDDEYDVQDAVEVLLRSLYSDVRHEEPTPSSAGSSSKIDLHLREGRIAVEIKVTAPGRTEKKVKQELLQDINDYRRHPTVDTLIATVYDLASTFENAAGFEHDLTEAYQDLDVHVVVVPWVGPKSSAAR